MKDKVYAQVYSLIRVNPEGTLNALRQLAAAGYDGVELLGQRTEGLSEKQFAAFLKGLGLKVISSHNLTTEDDFGFAARLGAKYTDLRPHYRDSSRDEILRCCEDLNAQGRRRAAAGLRAVVHNHAEEFWWVNDREGGERIYDLMLQNTDPAYVNFEFDVGWGARAGINPTDYVRQYAGRFPLLHVKECSTAAKNRDEMAHFPKFFTDAIRKDKKDGVQIPGAPKASSEKVMQAMYESRNWNSDLGDGLINWVELIAAAEAQGCEGYISEREYYHTRKVPDGDPVKCAAVDCAYMRSW